MQRVRAVVVAGVMAALLPRVAVAQNRSEDEYTRYELLSPETASFKIIYDVTAVSPGAKFFFNPIRQGSVATDESVIDLMTGAPLKFQEISGAEARESGLTNASLDGRYIRVELARPVPHDGEGRIRIIKTYKDSKSYHRDGNAIVFDRPLGIKRNAVVLPPGFELVSCNIPSQVIEESDGRVGISFMNTYPGQAPLILRGSPITSTARRDRVAHVRCLAITTLKGRTNDHVFVTDVANRDPGCCKHRTPVRGRRENGQTSSQAARMEVKQELGYPLRKLRRLGKIRPDSAISSSILDMFLGELGNGPPHDEPEPTEAFGEILHLTPEELGAKIVKGSVRDSYTIAALMIAQLRGYISPLLRNTTDATT